MSPNSAKQTLLPSTFRNAIGQGNGLLKTRAHLNWSRDEREPRMGSEAVKVEALPSPRPSARSKSDENCKFTRKYLPHDLSLQFPNGPG